MKTAISYDTPMYMLTLGQLAEFLDSYLAGVGVKTPVSADAPGQGHRYVYGIRGIMDLFHCSNVTVQRYKNGVIAEAVSQNGRKIVVDADKALELFKVSRALTIDSTVGQ